MKKLLFFVLSVNSVNSKECRKLTCFFNNSLKIVLSFVAYLIYNFHSTLFAYKLFTYTRGWECLKCNEISAVVTTNLIRAPCRSIFIVSVYTDFLIVIYSFFWRNFFIWCLSVSVKTASVSCCLLKKGRVKKIFQWELYTQIYYEKVLTPNTAFFKKNK